MWLDLQHLTLNFYIIYNKKYLHKHTLQFMYMYQTIKLLSDVVCLYSVLKYALNFQQSTFCDKKNQKLVFWFFCQGHFNIARVIIILIITCIRYNWLQCVRLVQDLTIFKKYISLVLIVKPSHLFSISTGIGHLHCKLIFVKFRIIIVFFQLFYEIQIFHIY